MPVFGAFPPEGLRPERRYIKQRRELEEETGISAEIGEVTTAVDAIERDENGAIRFHFVIIAVSCHSPRGAIRVGNDVSSVKWVSKAEIETLDLAIGFDIRAVLKASNF